MHLNKLASQSIHPVAGRGRDAAPLPADRSNEDATLSGQSDGVALSNGRPEVQKLQPQSSAEANQPAEQSIVQPEPGRLYEANRAQPRAIQLSFDSAAADFVKAAQLQVDLENAVLLTKDGRAIPLDSRVTSQPSPADGYAVASGSKLSSEAEPWQFRVPGTPGGIFGKPHGVHFTGGESGLGLKFLDAQGNVLERGAPSAALDDRQGFRVDTQVFRANRSATLGKVASHVPSQLGLIGPASLPFQDASFPNVTLRAPSKESLATVKNAFGQLLGPISSERAEKVDLKKLEVYEEQFQELLAKELKAGGEIDGMATMQKAMEIPTARQAMSDLLGAGAESLGNAELLNAVAEKAQRACPLEIVVIPRDKSAADCVEGSEDEKQSLQNVGRAWFQTSNPLFHRAQTGSKELPVQRLFVGEEILQSDKGVKAVLMHELLHIFEQRYATPEEGQLISSSFEEAQEFQSLYGSSRDEYLTTVSEEFLAAHGPDGPAWVQEQHPKLFGLLSKLLPAS